MTVHPSFDLVDEPWIPCVQSVDGRLVDVSLRIALTEPSRFREISDPSPLVTVALHRLLLAILHRSLDGPRDGEQWYRVWIDGWDTERVSRYLSEWQDKRRFDLFAPDRPFYQTSAIEYDYETSVADIVHGRMLGNYSTLFDHSVDASPPVLSAAEAARTLVGYQSFAPGGLITYRSRHGEPRPTFGSADAGLLTKSAVALIAGDNLHRTLTLNLHQYSGDDDAPFAFHDDDLPAWERDDPALGIDRYPAGYADLLTWQSRRIRFRPNVLPDGGVGVRHVVRMKGDQFPDRGDLANYETMVPFRRNPRATGGQPAWSELSLRADRALWRDSTVLFQSIENEHAQPKSTRWLASLATNGYLDRDRTFRLDLFGLCVDRATVYFWRHERLPLRIDYLDDRNLLGWLRQGLQLAEDTGRLFGDGWIPAPEGSTGSHHPSPMRVLAANLLSPASESSADPNAIRNLVASLNPAQVYWSLLERPFLRFMEHLAETWDPDDREEANAMDAMSDWVTDVRRVAQRAFDQTVGTLDLSDRELRAMARAERQMNWQLFRLTASYPNVREEAYR